MSNKLIWQDRFNIGVDIIDKEHKKMFSIMNKLLDFSEHESKRQWVCEEGVKYFKEHAMRHFAEEEVYMASIGYKEFEAHRRLHDKFRQKTIPELERELLQTQYSMESISHFLAVCAGWLIGHTLTEDRAIVGKAENRWLNLLPEEEQSEMVKAIIRILHDMFRLDSRLVSEHYGGEKFGRGVYYRLTYENENEQKWETILILEEKLIMNTVGKMMGESEQLDVMLMNATRYAARQFVQRIKAYLPAVDGYELKDENLLTYEQFRKIFERKNPQSSLLFNTGEGYFAYCVFAPHLHDYGSAVSIKAENAVSEVKHYLKQSKEEQIQNIHKKVLIVDDSDVMLLAMKQLLEGDYQIATAKSGLAAIRSISLNQPDLVLLDYEMPVCDGRQVLEMIRSEEDFKDIPVIFLTGRVDKESIQKVIALKPAGYLAKSMPPAEIKKNIDEFFEKKFGTK